MGTVGYEDVDCDTIDHTYIRLASGLLRINRDLELELFYSSQDIIFRA